MKNEPIEHKIFTIRIPKNQWLFLKKVSAEHEIPAVDIIRDLIEKYKKKYDTRVDIR